MTSMLDQFEQAYQKCKTIETTNVCPEMTTSGYLQMKLEEEIPMFSKKKLNFNPSDRITHLVVANDFLVLAMANDTLFRIDITNPERNDEITLSKYVSKNSRLKNLFLDPLGQHLLMSFTASGTNGVPELLYLPRKSAKVRQTTKFRNHEITAVGWNFANESDNTTGPILLGTSKGLILETEIGLEGDKIFQSGIEQYWRQLPNYLPIYGTKDEEGLVFEIGRGSNILITELEFHRIPYSDRYFIIVTTPNRFYQFIGTANSEDKPLLQQIFNKYLNVKETYQIVKSNLHYSKLCFYYGQPKGIPKKFAWLTEPGIYYGELDPFGLENSDLVINIKDSITYPEQVELSTSYKPTNIPNNFVITEFNALLLYNDTIKIVSLLNNELISDDNYPERIVNIAKDPIRGTIWVYTEHTIYRYKIYKEERNVWQIYCNENQFEAAKKYCVDNPINFDKVCIKEAEMLFEHGEYFKSARIFADTVSSSFEEVCLKFLKIQEFDPLKLYLQKKLEKLTVQDKTQITLIVLWIVEIYLKQLGELRNMGKEKTEGYDELQRSFENFLGLQVVVDCVNYNKQTVYDLMASHGDQHNLVKLTVANKDFEQVIRQHIYKNKYHEALEILKSQNNRELYYQFVPVLIQEIPKKTVSVLIQQNRNLLPVKLLPALVGCDMDDLHISEILGYLEHCVFIMGTTERAIHNFLISLYVKHRPEDKIKKYLVIQGQDPTMVSYDVYYALRLCEEKVFTESCVQLSAMLGLHESAVDLALTINLDLAKQVANMEENNNELKKKLWLKIARHVVSDKKDIQGAMKFLQQCDLIKIEDVLPFFADFDTIDHFKDAICTSLEEYNQKIQDLKEEMEEATKFAEVIREEIQEFRNKCAIIRAEDTCAICNLTLIVRPFYYFPCSHKFHSDCLIAEITPLLGTEKQSELADLNNKLSNLNRMPDNISTGTSLVSHREQLKADIDNIIASECVYCGSYMINEIDKPFVDDKEFEAVLKDWL